MTREKFPEKIPFRLTRMLTNAMEVRGLTWSGLISKHQVQLYRMCILHYFVDHYLSVLLNNE